MAAKPLGFRHGAPKMQTSVEIKWVDGRDKSEVTGSMSHMSPEVKGFLLGLGKSRSDPSKRIAKPHMILPVRGRLSNPSGMLTLLMA